MTAHRALLRWLLGLIQKAPDPFLTMGDVEAIAGELGDDIQAIEINLLGHRFRITATEVDG